MKKDELITLFTDSNEFVVQNVQDILNKNGIPSLHLSSSTRTPRAIGLRVRHCDFDKAKAIVDGIDLKPLKNIMQPSPSFQKSQRIGCFIYIGLIIIYFLYDFIKDLL